MLAKTDLSRYNNLWYNPRATVPVRLLWFVINWIFFASFNPSSSLKIILLRLFGAVVGMGVVIKPRINIKYPWNLKIGNYSWIGEGVWIDSLGKVDIGNHVCISQGALLLTGNHNYKKSTFDLIIGNITLEDGVWIGAKAIVCGGVTCKSHAVLTANSVASSTIDSYSVYRGNPAIKIRERNLGE